MFHRSERLLLRPFWPEDAPALARAIADPLILKNLSSPPSPYTLADAEAYCARAFDPLCPDFAIVRRTAGKPQLIGAIGLGRITAHPEEADAMQIGYWLAQPHWGLGYASEAARAVLPIARALGHRRLFARYFTDNPASGHVLVKLGFRPTGRGVPLRSAARRDVAPAVEMLCELGGETDRLPPMRPSRYRHGDADRALAA